MEEISQLKKQLDKSIADKKCKEEEIEIIKKQNDLLNCVSKNDSACGRCSSKDDEFRVLKGHLEKEKKEEKKRMKISCV